MHLIFYMIFPFIICSSYMNVSIYYFKQGNILGLCNNYHLNYVLQGVMQLQFNLKSWLQPVPNPKQSNFVQYAVEQ